ncbi:MAG: hypothetical protein ACTSV3_08695 [Candidatus Thorarchaeota archaeon]|nr:MAG: hypothetical protein DRP09_11245 [Candidatus Thorarchaeota archaeon]RLI58738.1 MAG: hypothetical protein DRO87_04960 [Candidatus Thorarchaeota archaeon]
MTREDDTFFEDDAEDQVDDAFFPDEEEEEEEEYDEDIDIEEEIVVSMSRGEQVSEFVNDPWPRTTFVLMLIGFVLVFLTPPDFWAAWRYLIIANYILVVMGGVALVYSLTTWSKSEGDRLRWAGITNIFVVIAGVVVGLIDTASWMLLGTSVIPSLDTSLLGFCFVLVLFSLYSLWMIQKSFDSASPR